MNIIIRQIFIGLFFSTTGLFSSTLEEEIASIKKRLSAIEAQLSSIETKKKFTNISQGDQEKDTFVSKVADAVWAQKRKVDHSWYRKDLWDSITVGISEEKVVQILGKPTRIEPSLNKRIDSVLIYEIRSGLLTKSKIQGILKSRKGKIVFVEKPPF